MYKCSQLCADQTSILQLGWHNQFLSKERWWTSPCCRVTMSPSKPYILFLTLLEWVPHVNYCHLFSQDLGRLPFVRTGRPDWSVRKWNARVLRTERTGSGQTGSADEVGLLSSLSPARNARSAPSGIWRQVYWFARALTVKAVSFLFSMGGQPNVYALLELTN